MSAYHLQRSFKRYVGLTPREYVKSRRTNRFKQSLRNGDTVTRATFDAGYSSSSRVYEQVGSNMGMTPAVYRRSGQGVRVRFVTVPTPVGRMLVAATERGVCAISLGDDDVILEAELRREYSRATIERDAGGLTAWVAEIVCYLEGTVRDLRTPLDVDSSAFQWRVWKALREIPFGETRSYRQVAEEVGRPAAARAVAQACASNRVALVIPCHRVVRNDGALGGYRWGTERKRLLLDHEAGGEQQG